LQKEKVKIWQKIKSFQWGSRVGTPRNWGGGNEKGGKKEGKQQGIEFTKGKGGTRGKLSTLGGINSQKDKTNVPKEGAMRG